METLKYWVKNTLNNGDEYIRVSGIVRPRDISSDNVVPSDRIANADIDYIGAVIPVLEEGLYQNFLKPFSDIGEKYENIQASFSLIAFYTFVLSPSIWRQVERLNFLAGVRSNQLVGYGAVVGLAGTGDGNTGITSIDAVTCFQIPSNVGG